MKKGRNNRVKWVHLRVSQEEYDLLQSRFKGTTCRKVSELARDILFQRPIRVFYRNKSADELLPVFLDLKKELNSIGTNINQVIKKIHVFSNERELSVLLFDLEIRQEILLGKADEIRKRMHEIYNYLSDEISTKKSYIIEPIFPVKMQAAAA